MGRPAKSNLQPELLKLLRAIGANLQAERQDRRLTQAQLAKQSKVSITTINEIEARRFRDVRLSTLVALADALSVPVLQLLRGSDLAKLRPGDQSRLLRAGEDIIRITKKLAEPE